MTALVETVMSPIHVLSEAKTEGPLRVRARVLSADVVNANKRRYPAALVKREVKKLSERIANGLVLGSGGHPDGGRTGWDDVACKWDKIWLEENDVHAEGTVLETGRGKTLAALLRVCDRLPVSVRGFGVTRPGRWHGEAVEEVDESYSMESVDFLIGAEPGFPGASAEVIREMLEAQHAYLFTPEQRCQAILCGLPDPIPIVHAPLTEEQRSQRRLCSIYD